MSDLFSTLPHPFVDLSQAKVCLFTKDPAKPYKEMVAGLGIKSISKIISVSRLSKKYGSFEAKRQLCSSFDVFLADTRVLSLLPRLLGKTFYERKKLPLPISIPSPGSQHADFRRHLLDVLSCTCTALNNGPCVSIKVGKASQPLEQLSANISSAIDQLDTIIPSGHANIRSLHLKTKSSDAIPLFNTTASLLPA